MDVLKKLKITENHPGAAAGMSWLAVEKLSVLSSFNPATNTSLASVQTADAGAYDAIVSIAAKTFSEWRMVSAPNRAELVRKIVDKLRANKQSLGELVALEMGKSLQEGLGEVQEMIDMGDFAIGQARMLYGQTMQSERPRHRMYEQWHPYGVVGVITAFNFPVAVWAWNAFIAAVCGNTVIWKPSSKVPLCAIAVHHMCCEAMQELNMDGVFSLCITHDEYLTNQLVEDRRIPLISFTGSTKIGKQIAEKIAHRLGRVILELGGNNAIVVDSSANIDLAVRAILFGAVGTAGQRCTTTRRLFIQENVAQDLIKALIAAYQQVTIGDPLDTKNLMGPLIDQVAVIQYQNAIQEIKAQGGTILFGGNVLNQIGFFVEPCLVRAENHWDIVQRETFAPILYVMTFKDLTEAIAMQNAVKQGLSSALFTNQLKNAELFLSSVGSDCGIANINIGTSGAEIGGAFGGEKDTGGGREAGSDVWKAYMRRQTNTINWSDELPLAQGIKFQ